MPRPKTRLPWTQQTSDKKFKKALLTRAIRANENRARNTRDPEERAHYLEANQVLERKRAQLTPAERKTP